MITVALAALCLAPTQVATISFETRAARLSQVLSELSTKAKMKLEASPVLANDILIVQAESVPLDVLLTKIASVTSAEWKLDGDVNRLVVSQSAMNREQLEERTRRLEGIRKAVKERAAAAAEDPTRSGDTEGMPARAMMARSTPDKTITQILQALDVTPIANLNANERVVFSTNPTRMQRPLPSNAGRLIQAMIVEHNNNIAKIKDRPISEEEEKIMAGMPDFVKQMMERQTKKVENPSKALLIASRTDMGFFAATSLELRVYDQEGKVGYSHTTQLANPMMEAMMDDMENVGKAPKADVKMVPVTYSADSKALVSNLSGFTMGGMTVNLEPKVREKLAQPDKIDPLSYMATDELFSVAKAKKKALVANVPDAMMSSMGMMMPGGGEQTVEEVENELSLSEDTSFSETDGWVIVRPRQPAKSRLNRTDRVGLATLIKASDAKGVPSLDDIAAYAQTSPSPMENGIGQLYAMLMVPGLFNMGMSGMTDWNTFKLYGSFGATQRQNLLNGGRITVNGMTPNQQALWRTMLFGTISTIRVGEYKEDPTNMFMGMAAFMGGSFSNDFRQEPTELMPNGLPQDAVMTMSSTAQLFSSPVNDKGSIQSGYLGVLGLDELAMFKMFKEDPNMAQVSGFMPSIDRMRIGQRTNYTIRLDLPMQAYSVQTLQDNRLDKNAPIFAMNSLPADFQKQLDARIEMLKKSPLGMIGGMMGGMRGTIKP